MVRAKSEAYNLIASPLNLLLFCQKKINNKCQIKLNVGSQEDILCECC